MIIYSPRTQQPTNILTIYKNFDEFKLFQKEQQNKTIEKQRIVQKKFPDVIFLAPEISKMFIEFE